MNFLIIMSQHLLFTQLINGETKMQQEEMISKKEFKTFKNIYLAQNSIICRLYIEQSKELAEKQITIEYFRKALELVEEVCETTKDIDPILKKQIITIIYNR